MTDTYQKTATVTKAPMFSMAQVAPWVIAVIFLMVLPIAFGSNSAITIMNQMMITIVFALSYNMLLGQGGMLSFGHAVYMGVGGFFCMHLMNIVEANELPIPLPVLPIFGGLFGLGLATIVGSFSTRKAGTVFAMISLGIGELIAACSVIIVAFFGGEEGMPGDRTYFLPFFGTEFLRQIEVYYLIAFWTVLSALLMYLFSRTPVGRMANAVRDNPERAEFLGYSARWVRFFSFCGAGFFAGIAGGLFAINYEILTETNLSTTQSGIILLITFLGGVGFFFGPIIGAIVFTLLQSVLSLQSEIWQLYL
ncbi:MAG: branched-chain amino acid ABC transporter permease, partial [Pseudomonadota bacterium]|nr:branched-chain amino acid ABC transporter permease [Pseudomonadota bacterium]